MQPQDDQIQWFAMSAPYCRELKAMEALGERGIETFIAMQWRNVRKSRTGPVATRPLERVLMPVIHNLIFVHATRSRIQEAKLRIPYLQWRTMPSGGRNVPMVVPDYQMDAFIKICNTRNSGITFYAPGEIEIKPGTRVRIIGGEFSGIEGVLLKQKGKNSNRVVVELPNLGSLATATLPADLLEII
ncbi:MAG: UpxY family transcription antiterminator [Bacteroidales bacterium]|nr:UpxY family transcription antiterminator [Bacteroidales bacterium]